MLEIRLLGQFEVRATGQVVEVASRPAQALLAYLALTPGIAYRRELLAGLFWPESGEANARGYLRQALWRLRKALPDAAGVTITADDLTVALTASSNLWVDVGELEDDSADLEARASVYQGPLLPGFYYDWADSARDRLQAVYDGVLARLLDQLVADRQWTNVLGWGERWVAQAHAPEPAYRALMLAHAGLGDRASAVAVFQRCQAALARELGVEPSAATRAVYDHILQPTIVDSSGPAMVGVAERLRHHVSLTPNPLPHPLTSFIGRGKELADVHVLLTGEGRLVTLIGVGGSGKTRLALQAAQAVQDRFPQGVWFVDFAPLADGALVPKTVANGLGLVEEPGRPILTTLLEFLQTKTGLLILDNCEHLVEACAGLAQTLRQTCPTLCILASSREALQVPGEVVVSVPSLPSPAGLSGLPVTELMANEAVRLFVERAVTALPGFALTSENAEAVTQICARLDGMPLAIELAAARVRVLTPSQIAERLDNRFRLLTGGNRLAVPRQQTLRATMDWSYNLLSAQEQMLLRVLAVFVGGWTLEAAEALVGDAQLCAEDVLDLLTQLVNKSLVLAEQDTTTARYRLLETIRQYALEKLEEANEADAARERHLAYFKNLAEQAERELIGPRQVAWVNLLEKEIDNVRAALEWALTHDVAAGLILAARLSRFWEAHNYSPEGADWLGQLLERAEQVPVEVKALALGVHGFLFLNQGFVAVGVAEGEKALALYRQLGNRLGEGLSLMLVGGALFMKGDIVQARPLLEQSIAIFKAENYILGQAEALTWLSLDRRYGRPSLEILKESLALHRQLGHLAGIASSLVGLAQQYYWDGEYEEGPALLEEAMALQKQLGSQTGMSWVLENYGNLTFRMRKYDKAEEYYAESARLSEAAGLYLGGIWARTNLAHIALRKGEIAKARSMFAHNIADFQRAKIEIGLVYAVEGLASLAAREEKWEKAARLIGWADAMRIQIGDPRPATEQKDLDEDLAPVRAALTADVYAKAQDAGRAFNLEQALALGLAED